MDNCNECKKIRGECAGRISRHCPCSSEKDGALSSYDWLKDLPLAAGESPFEYVELRFKNGRKAFFRNENKLEINEGDTIAVEAVPGHDIGTVTLTGIAAHLQMRYKGIAFDSEDVKKIYRKATQKDIETWKTAIGREKDTLIKTRDICKRLKLVLKLCDVEFQGDNLKATFFYTAEGRVDFRQLIKELASAFSIRVEMRQIGLRQEAAKVGGTGSCGRELCCSTYLSDFNSVNTSSARTQHLSLNPQKLAGQCGKLKCCLNYELDIYTDALKDFPNCEHPLHTVKGKALFQKMDVFKGLYWYAYAEDPVNWICLPVKDVKEIIERNKRREPVESLEVYSEKNENDAQKSKQRSNEVSAVEEGSLNRFDNKQAGTTNRHRRNKQNNRQKNA